VVNYARITITMTPSSAASSPTENRQYDGVLG